MARSAAPQPPGNDSEPSIGDLVSQAIRDVTQLVRCELALAKLELRDDAKRLGLAAALLAITAFTCCLILVLLSFAFAYGLVALGIWIWAAFLIVAGVCAAAGRARGPHRDCQGARRQRPGEDEADRPAGPGAAQAGR